MRNLFKTALIVALLISLGANVFMWQRFRNRRVYMTINNHPVTQQDIYDRMTQQSGEPIKAQIALRQIIHDEAEKEKLVPTEAEIQEEYAHQREANWQFAQKMAQNPWAEIEAKDAIRQNMELLRLMTAKIPVTDDQIKEEYATQPAVFDTPNKAYCYLGLITSTENIDNIKQLMEKEIAPSSIQQNYPKEVFFPGENTLQVGTKPVTNLFISTQAFGSKQNAVIFQMKPGEVKILPPGELAQKGVKALIVRMVKIVPGQPANLSDPKIHEKIRMAVAAKRATNANDYILKLWQAADFHSEDPNDKINIGRMLGEKTK